MQWVAISGSRKINRAIEADVRRSVREIMAAGNGIVAGGAPGVDYIAVDEGLRHNPDASRIKVIIPVSLDEYERYFRSRVRNRSLPNREVNALLQQLKKIKGLQPEHFIELKGDRCNTRTYHERNSEVVKQSSLVQAFQVNASTGTQDTIDKAKKAGKPVNVASYTIG